MDFIQKMSKYFLLLRKQVKRHRAAVVTVMCAIVFATTYALVLPAVTLDQDDANNDPAISVQQASEDQASEADSHEEATEPTDTKTQAKTDEATKTAAKSDSSQTAAPKVAAAKLKATKGDYKVSAEYGEDAKLPEGAKLKVSTISEDSSDYVAAKKAVAKKESLGGAKVSTKDFGMKALDISLVDKDGKKVEPADGAKVNVKIDMDQLPSGVSNKVLESTLKVEHIDSKSGKVNTVAEAAAKDSDNKITVNKTNATASFDVDSFSTFTITWSLLQSEKAVYTIHTVDTNGKEITKPDVQDVNIDNLTPVVFADHADMDGYEFESAHLGSFDGQQVTDVDFKAQLSLDGLLKVTYNNNGKQVDEDDVQLIAAPKDKAERDVYFVYKKVLTDKASDGSSVKMAFDADAGIDNATAKISTLAHPNHWYIEQLWAQLEKGNTAVNDFRFYNIGLKKGVEPKTAVETTVKLVDPLKVTDGDKIQIVHFKGDGSIETIDANYQAKDGEVSSVTFDADSYSIYAITETTQNVDKTYRRTYTFQNDDGNPYEFTLNGNDPTKTGNETQNNTTTSEQIVKNGGKLLNVGTPVSTKNTDTHKREFLGWGVVTGEGESATVDEKNLITTDQLQSEDGYVVSNLTGDENVTLRAVYSNQINITFHDETGAVIHIQKADPAATVNLDKVQTDGTGDVALVGWAREQQGKTVDGDKTTYVDKAPDYTDKITTEGSDIDLYPVFKSAHWLNFDSNDGGDGSATYIAPVRYAEGQTTVAPTDPQRQGYTFGGWYTDQNCTTPFTFGGTLSSNPIIYAKWDAAETTYRVVIWRQRVTDDKNAVDANKTYDYAESATVNAHTGDKIDANGLSNYEELAEDAYTNNAHQNYRGFQFAFAGASRTSDTSAITVKGDGSTVVNVYYDRQLITINFADGDDYSQVSNPSLDSGYVYYGNISGTYYRLYWAQNHWAYARNNVAYTYANNRAFYTRGNDANKTMTGLYGQSFAQNGYSWPGEDGPWYYMPKGDTTDYISPSAMTYLQEFVLPRSALSNTEIQFVKGDNSQRTDYYYLQNADGTWPHEPTITVGTTGNQKANFSNQPNAKFNATQYQLNNDGNSGDTGNWTNISYVNDSASVNVSNATSLGVRYARNSYTIEFHNGSNKVNNDKTMLYEAPLSSLSDYNTAGSDSNKALNLEYTGNDSEKEHYEFAGWFAGPECTTYVTFGTDLTDEQKQNLKNRYKGITSFVNYPTMPDHNLVVYAGWMPKQYTATVDANGGTLNVPEKLMSDWNASTDDNYKTVTFKIEYEEQIPEIIKEASEDRASVSRDGYEFLGWMVDDESGDPYNFNSPVMKDVKLVAKWRSTASVKISYDAVQGTNPPTDDMHYRDRSSATVKAAPTAPTGYEFVGWADKNGTIYVPGKTFEINASEQAGEADENNVRTVTLTAVYTKIGTTYVQYDANGGSGTLTNPSGIVNNVQPSLPLNSAVALSDGSGFTRSGYVFTGWNTQADGKGTHYVPGDTYGVDGDGNTLYAEWAPILNIKKVATSGSSLSGATFKLTDQSDKNVTAGNFYGTVTVPEDGYTVTTDENGTVSFAGALKDGSYKLTETTAPSGYVINNSDVTFTVSNGEATNVTNATYDSNTHTFTITNTPGSPLPNTGGEGTWTYTAAGVVLILLALTGGFVLRRKNRGEGGC